MTSSTAGAVAVRRSGLRVAALEAGLSVAVEDGVEIAAGGAPIGAGAAIADLSTCPRIGLKGRESGRWLRARGVPLPDRPNRLVAYAHGLVVARYAENEFVLASFSAASCPAIDAAAAALAPACPAGVYLVPRADSQAALGLAGERAIEALASLCAADLRAAAFGPGDVLQTLCAGIGAQLLNLSAPAGPLRVALLCDASYARHAWDALTDALAAEGGAVASQSGWFAATAAR